MNQDDKDNTVSTLPAEGELDFELIERTLRMCEAGKGHSVGMISLPVETLRPLLKLALSRPPAAGWRSIDGAPKDETPVLLWYPKRYQGKGGVSWGCFINGEWLDSRAIRDNDATLWQPLPAPPAPAQAEGEG